MWSVWMFLLSQMDADDELPPTVAELIAVDGLAQPDVVPVVMVNVRTNVIWDDRFSPGVGYCIPLDRPNCIDFAEKEHRELLENDWDSSLTCGYGSLDALDCCDLRVSETVWAG